MIVVILAIVVLAALGAALVLTTTTETIIAAHHRRGVETFHAAEAGLERSFVDLLREPDWNAVLSGAVKSSFTDGGAGTLPDGQPILLAALTAELQADADRSYGSSPNRPVWRLYVHAPIASLLPAGMVTARDYVVVWVADDPGDNDMDAGADANGLILVRCEAYGEGSSRRVVESTVARTIVVDKVSGESHPVTRVVAWREVR